MGTCLVSFLLHQDLSFSAMASAMRSIGLLACAFFLFPIAASRTIHVRNRCPGTIPLYRNGASEGSLDQGERMSLEVEDTWEGFLYTSANGGSQSGQGSVKVGFYGQVSSHAYKKVEQGRPILSTGELLLHRQRLSDSERWHLCCSKRWWRMWMFGGLFSPPWESYVTESDSPQESCEEIRCSSIKCSTARIYSTIPSTFPSPTERAPLIPLFGCQSDSFAVT